MTAMPELVAGFHSLVGLAAVFVAISAFINPSAFNLGTPGNIKLASLIEMAIGAAVGAITFSGSVIAFLKLQGIMSGAPITFKGQHFLNASLLILIVILTIYLCSTQSSNLFWILIAVSFLIGFLIIIPIGGADMPVVISMLNSYSGWAAAGIGFTLENTALIITGALVGSSGAILSYIMCKGMNRSFFNVILGGFGATEQSSSSQNKEQRPVKSGNADDAAASSAFPLLTGLCSLFCDDDDCSVAPKPPKITLKNDLFIPLHIMYDNIAPDDPTSAPVIISAVFSKVKPIPAAAQPE